jgi:hypothetical protein
MWSALLVALALAACGRSSSVPDDQLAGLVVAPQPPPPINVARALHDVAELTRAVAASHDSVVAALGPHTLAITLTTTITDAAGKPTTELGERYDLVAGEGGAFHGTYTNSADYGRETIFVAGRVFLRPRYQRWHGRAPETPEEPAQLRAGFYSAIAATWDLVAPGAALSQASTIQIAGRTGRKLAVTLASEPRPNPNERIVQRKWRELREVTALAGEVVLDSESGLPLAVALHATVGFVRDGKRHAMKLALDAKLVSRGPVALAAPNAAEVVATPERKHEVDDRDALLKDLAPPAAAASAGKSAPGGTP